MGNQHHLMKMFRQLLRRFHRFPLRWQLILGFLALIAVAGIVSIVLGTRLEHRTIISLAETKVRHDLASAWMVYNESLSSLRDVIRLSTAREFIKDYFRQGDEAGTVKKLDDIRHEFHLDILTLTDASGRVALRSRQPQVRGDDQSGDPLVLRALGKKVAAGTQIVSRAELLKEGTDLAEQAYFEFVPTLMADARPENHEEDGMMLKAAAPVSDDYGRLLGVLYGGLLINRNYATVDKVKDIVYRGEKYKGKDMGTATIFQRDLRIATNVLDDKGGRAIGTRVSRDINRGVLQEGRTYVGRAFVVAHWYITAYAPIRDVADRIVGMLYVGILEKPYIDIRNKVMGTFMIMAGSATVFLLALLSVIAANITRPLRVLVEATSMVAKGDLAHRVEIDHGDELGQLAIAFNSMTDDLRRANEKLTRWGRMLEKRVEERTLELQEIEENLVRSERLASLGKIAAGVAHEINNPLTSILIYSYLLLERCDPQAENYESLTLIAEETSRCAQIVKGLLEFARQRPAQSALSDVNQIVERTVQLLEKQALVRNIRIIKNLDLNLPEILLDRDKIQQVFSNLVINACEAMPAGGTLTITSQLDPGGSEVMIIFADTGVGIPKENIHKLFDPFFTTKSIGTGLGLAVSYGIIRQRGGTIDVESEAGKGSVFTVRFPAREIANETGLERVADD